MNKWMKVVLGIVVVFGVLFAGLEFALDIIVLKAVNAAGPAALGVPVTLQDASFSLVRGKLALKGLHIGNPPGYKTDGLFDLGSISVDIDNSTLLSDTIVVKNIAIDGLVLTFEKGLLNNNLNALIAQLSAGEEEKSAAEAEQEKPAKEEKPGKKIVIEKLSISGSKMNFSITGAAALTGGGAIPIPLPPITLTDLGKEKEGLTIPEAIQNVLHAILGTAGKALTGATDLVGDAGQAVVGGTVDAGKAVVGGTVDAGKAVVDGAAGALKAINPFDKKE